MKVALVHTRLMPRGGLETRLFSYMAFFLARGDDVSIIVYKIGADVTVPKGVRVHLAPVRWLPKKMRAFFFDRSVGKICSQNHFDLVISLGRTSHQDALVVPGVHRAFLKALGKRFTGPNDWMQSYLDDKAYRSPGVLLASSELIKQQIIEFHCINPAKIQVLHPPSDAKRFHQKHKDNKGSLRKQFGFHPDHQSFLLVSSNHWLKGLPLLLKVFKQLQDHPVELIVVGGQKVKSNLKNVKHLGFVKETEKLYAAADFSILASRYESFGQVVAESLLCGTPVIISDQVGAKSIVETETGIIVSGFVPKDWVDAILSALNRSFSIDSDLAVQLQLRPQDHLTRLLQLLGKE